MSELKKKPRIIKICDTCGKEFSVIPSRSNAKYCSTKCCYASRNGSGNPHYGKPAWNSGKGHKIKKNCEICDIEFFVTPSRENTAKFCSLDCFYLSDSHINAITRKRTDEAKANMSKAHKGQIPWIKGKHIIFSEDHKKHISEGRIKSAAVKIAAINMRGENNPAKRPEVRKKLSIHNHLPDVLENNRLKNSGKNNTAYGKPKSDEFKRLVSIANSGKNNAQWRGGISFLPYIFEFDNKFKEYIRDKFNRNCFICDKPEKDSRCRLVVHHINYDKLTNCNNNSWKFIPLCNKCHGKTNHNRWYWFNLLINYWINNPEINFDCYSLIISM